MTEDAGSPHRRRRRRATSAQGAPEPRTDHPTATAAAAPIPPSAPANPPAHPAAEASGRAPAKTSAAAPAAARPRRAKGSRDNAERGLRDIVGAGRSQLGVSGALRGRDVNRPTEADLAEAEESLLIVRRNWQPMDKK